MTKSPSVDVADISAFIHPRPSWRAGEWYEDVASTREATFADTAGGRLAADTKASRLCGN